MNLSAAELRLLYGGRVCAFVAPERACVLTPPAQETLDELNNGMDNGHCYGFATLSLLLYRGLWPPFGPGQPYRIKLEDSSAVQRTSRTRGRGRRCLVSSPRESKQPQDRSFVR